MLENPVLDHLSQALTRANHDADWFFEHIDFDGSLAFNCWLPTDSRRNFHHGSVGRPQDLSATATMFLKDCLMKSKLSLRML